MKKIKKWKFIRLKFAKEFLFDTIDLLSQNGDILWDRGQYGEVA